MERSAVPHLRDVLRWEHDEMLKGCPRNEALEKWGAHIEAEILGDIQPRDKLTPYRSKPILRFGDSGSVFI
jgi:hypothetical protein